MTWIRLPLAVMVLFSSSMMVPSKEPWTESRRSRLARLTRSFSGPCGPRWRAGAGRRRRRFFRSGCAPADGRYGRSRRGRRRCRCGRAVLLADHVGQFVTDEVIGDAPLPSALNLAVRRPRSIDAAPSFSSRHGLEQRACFVEGAALRCSSGERSGEP